MFTVQAASLSVEFRAGGGAVDTGFQLTALSIEGIILFFFIQVVLCCSFVSSAKVFFRFVFVCQWFRTIAFSWKNFPLRVFFVFILFFTRNSLFVNLWQYLLCFIFVFSGVVLVFLKTIHLSILNINDHIWQDSKTKQRKNVRIWLNKFLVVGKYAHPYWNLAFPFVPAASSSLDLTSV